MRSLHRVRRALGATLTLALVLVFTITPIAPAAGTTYYVDPAGGSDAAAGTSEGTAFKTINHAMEVKAVSGDTIICLPGTYSPSTNGESSPIDFTAGVTLRSRDGAKTTIIDAEESGSEMFYIEDATWGTQIKGFTITRVADFSPAVEIYASTAQAQDGWPRIKECVFTDHGTRAGVIYLWGTSSHWASAVVADCDFLENGHWPDGDYHDQGGAIECGFFVDLTVTRCDFYQNIAENYGGAIYSPGDADITIRGSVFEDNYSDQDGGALYIEGTNTTLLVDACEFVDNEANNDGGSVYAENFESMTIEDSSFVSNTAGGDAAGVYMAEIDASTISNNLFVKNGADNGGAVYSNDSTATAAHNTLFKNTGTHGQYYVDAGEVLFANSIARGNGGTDIHGCTVRYSCVDDTDLSDDSNTVGAGNITSDPMFFGGTDFRLKAGSPCIDTARAGDAVTPDAMGTTRPQDGDGNGSVLPDMGYWEKPLPESARWAGDDRYETACAIAKATFDTDPDTAIIASGENFPDALSAAGIASSYEAPLLLVKQDSVPQIVLDTLADWGTGDLVIVGGTAAVSAGVMTSLETAGFDVTRIWGANRYETSAKVARAVAANEGGDFSKRAFMARGDDFPDALSVAPLAYSDVSPILLTAPTYLPDSVSSALGDLDVEEAYLCGGTAAVSAGVKTAVDGKLGANGGTASTRWAGANRYETAATIANGGVSGGFSSWDSVGIATGANFPDALAGGIGIGNQGGVVLLTETASLPTATQQALAANKAIVVYAGVFGGTVAVNASVQAAIEAALGW